jgi:hypothetical protein
VEGSQKEAVFPLAGLAPKGAAPVLADEPVVVAEPVIVDDPVVVDEPVAAEDDEVVTPLPKGAGDHVVDGGELPEMVNDYANEDVDDEEPGPKRDQ